METKAEGRKRSYIITERGCRVLQKDYERLTMMVNEGSRILREI